MSFKAQWNLDAEIIVVRANVAASSLFDQGTVA